ncbi:MAG TPA: hypothetical protein VG387_17710 [Rhizomicrobium sp.]|jgi:hypothetical protein|nr:hypothetical protein [Rhizomicrobium sp.]
MMTSVSRGAFAALLLSGAALPAFAEPADCSVGTVADKPVSGSVMGKPFVPDKIHVDVTKDGMEVDRAKFDRYTLNIETGGIFNEATVDMLVPLGKSPAGRTFRVLPVDSIGGQPAAAPGTPEVQGWSLQLEAANVDTSFTQEPASIRVEWGAAKGGALAGKIHFCVPGQKTEIEGAFNATVVR